MLSPSPVITGPNPPQLPNPWAGQRPKSTEQPRLVVKLCSFVDRKLECRNGGKYPYDLQVPGNESHKVPYYELLGYGLPPSDVGNPGDIYVDRTPPCMVYVRTMDQWMWWDMSVKREFSDLQSTLMPQHPILSNRYLWTTYGGSSRLSWLTKQTIRNSMDYLVNHIATIVEKMYQGPHKPSKEEGERMEIEKNRRLLLTQTTLTLLSGKRGRPLSPVGDQSSQLNSSNNIGISDTHTGKKAKLTPNITAEDTEGGIGPDEEARHSAGSIRHPGASLSYISPHHSKEVPKLSLDYGSDLEAGGNDIVVKLMQGIRVPRDPEGNPRTPQSVYLHLRA